MVEITSLICRVCYNSRGQESIEVDVITDGKYLGRAAAPAGASTGKYEAIAFPNGVERAVRLLDENKSMFIGIDATDPKALYDVLKSIDGTDNYSIIGGAAAYALSIAAIDSAAKALGKPLFMLIANDREYRFPYPLGNILGGGAHAGPGTPDIQEYLVVPICAKGIREAVSMNIHVHRTLKRVLESKDSKFTYGRGDEGAWAPNIYNREALDAVEKACIDSGYSLGKDIAIGIDFASSSLWDASKERYVYGREGKVLSKEEQLEYVSDMIKDYRLIYVEDPLHEEDFDGMSELVKRFNDSTYITGDDLLVTNVKRLDWAIKRRACNAAILKVNQAGSLFDALMFASKANSNGIRLVTSHRSGESNDAHISHIAIATGSKMLKAGVVGGERIAKLNELIRIDELGVIKGMAIL